MPCPISTCGIRSVVLPSRPIRMKALGAKPCGAPLCGACAKSARATGMWKPSRKPPATPALKRDRREVATVVIVFLSSLLRGALDGFADPDIGAAATDIACHRRVDIGIVGLWRRGQKRCRGHNLARLAIAALHDLQVEPSLLDLGAGRRRGDTFDGGNSAVADRADRQQA